VVDENSAVNTLASGARITRRGKHRTEVTEGDSDGGRKFRCEHLGVRRENHAKKKHRTEVTEGDSDGGRKFRCEHLGVRRENHAKKKVASYFSRLSPH
jgi:hypothetical protein